MKLTEDASMNSRLASEVQGLRGSMADAAESVQIPARFTANAHPDRPAMVITDAQTGRSTTVSLCDYRGVREVLAELFA
jgi:hypothetical protein